MAKETPDVVANDRPQPLHAPAGVAERRAAAPGSQQSVLGDVLSLVRVAGVVVGHAQAEALDLIPLPTVARIPVLDDGNVDCSTVLLLKPNG